MKHRVRIFSGLMICGIMLLFAAGCQTPEQAALTKLRQNPSPEMVGMANSPWLQKNIYARTHDTNRRQFVDDSDAFWLVNRPSWMSYYVVP